MAVRAENDNASALATLLRRREEVEAWLDGPAKMATLTVIEREIAEHEASQTARDQDAVRLSAR